VAQWEGLDEEHGVAQLFRILQFINKKGYFFDGRRDIQNLMTKTDCSQKE